MKSNSFKCGILNLITIFGINEVSFSKKSYFHTFFLLSPYVLIKVIVDECFMGKVIIFKALRGVA